MIKAEDLKERHVFPAFDLPSVPLDEYKASGQLCSGTLLLLECDSCHQTKPDVREVEDPYVKELNEESVLTNLCDDCLQNRMNDI